MEPDFRNHWLVVLAAGLAVFMATVDASIVNLALPAISANFAASPGRTEWVVLGYLLAMTALILPAGRWLDGAGRRPAMVLALAGFAVASLAAATSPTLGALTAARVVQGAFGAMIAAQVPALVARAVRPDVRGRALGIIGALGPLGAASGPAAGGMLVDTLGWRSVFLVNIPVILIVSILLLRHLPPAAEQLRGPGRSQLTDAGLLADRWGSGRTAVTGAWLVAAADLFLVQATTSSRPVDLSWRLALVGLGMGLFSGPNQTTVMNLAPRDALATAGAATGLTRSLGFALGPALCTLMWATSGYSAAGLSAALILPVTIATAAGITLGVSSLLPRWPHRHRTQPTSARMARTPVRAEYKSSYRTGP